MSKKILVIEDSASTALKIKDLLTEKGYSVVVVGTGEDGVDQVESINPDLVLIDTVLPGIDGFEVCRTIKNKMGSKSPKLVINTGNISAVDAKKLQDSGADDYCPKTADFCELLEVVQEWI